MLDDLFFNVGLFFFSVLLVEQFVYFIVLAIRSPARKMRWQYRFVIAVALISGPLAWWRFGLAWLGVCIVAACILMLAIFARRLRTVERMPVLPWLVAPVLLLSYLALDQGMFYTKTHLPRLLKWLSLWEKVNQDKWIETFAILPAILAAAALAWMSIAMFFYLFCSKKAAEKGVGSTIQG